MTYEAKLRTKNLDGQAYLEMWCHFPNTEEYYSRAIQGPLSETNEWTSLQVHFYLKKGDNPDSVRLNIFINGKGTVWIDDIRLLKGPLS